MIFHNKKMKKLLMLIALALCASVSGHVLATLLAPTSLEENIQTPEIIGTFKMALDVNDVDDLYAWQVAIVYDSSHLKVLEMIPGGFVGDDFPLFVNSTDSLEDLLLLGGSLRGECPGKSGSGRLAIVTFGYLTETYDEPEIVPGQVFKTFLIDSKNQLILISESTLTLTVIE